MKAKSPRETQSQSLMKQLASGEGTATSTTANDQLLITLADRKSQGKKTDIPVNLIHFGSNQRSEIGDINALKEQIRTAGLLQPIGIQLLDGQITVVYGNRRLKAYKELALENPEKFSSISCIIQVYQDAEESRIIAQAIENLGREDLSPLDECIAINETKAALSAKKGTPVSNEVLGDFLGGRHRKTIDLAIAIANWPQSAHDLIRSQTDKYLISTLRNIAKKNLSEEKLLHELAMVIAEPQAQEEKLMKEDPLYEKPRRDQLKKFDAFLESSNMPENVREFLRKQNKWLWSTEARLAVKKVLDEYFEGHA
jgi:ParB/RepB/Spo0J family partition protein